jgi:hypothetical protein
MADKTIKIHNADPVMVEAKNFVHTAIKPLSTSAVGDIEMHYGLPFTVTDAGEGVLVLTRVVPEADEAALVATGRFEDDTPEA